MKEKWTKEDIWGKNLESKISVLELVEKRNDFWNRKMNNRFRDSANFH
jgi:hypothetical protein